MHMLTPWNTLSSRSILWSLKKSSDLPIHAVPLLLPSQCLAEHCFLQSKPWRGMMEKQIEYLPKAPKFGKFEQCLFFSALFAVFQDASRLHTLKLHHGIRTWETGCLRVALKQRQLWIKEHKEHKLIAGVVGWREQGDS